MFSLLVRIRGSSRKSPIISHLFETTVIAFAWTVNDWSAREPNNAFQWLFLYNCIRINCISAWKRWTSIESDGIQYGLLKNLKISLLKV